MKNNNKFKKISVDKLPKLTSDDLRRNRLFTQKEEDSSVLSLYQQMMSDERKVTLNLLNRQSSMQL